MQQVSDVIFTIEGAVATITLNRTARHNALTTGMLDDIERCVAIVEHNDEVRAEVHFEQSTILLQRRRHRRMGRHRPANDGRAIHSGWEPRLSQDRRKLDKPTIAVLAGSASGRRTRTRIGLRLPLCER